MLSQRDKIITANQSLNKFLPNRKTSREFIFIDPERELHKTTSKKLGKLRRCNNNEKAKLLTLLQRHQPSENTNEKKNEATSSSPAGNREDIGKHVSKSLSKMKPWQLEKSKPTLLNFTTPLMSLSLKSVFLTLDVQPISMKATSFL